jgi:hypothetical protein
MNKKLLAIKQKHQQSQLPNVNTVHLEKSLLGKMKTMLTDHFAQKKVDDLQAVKNPNNQARVDNYTATPKKPLSKQLEEIKSKHIKDSAESRNKQIYQQAIEKEAVKEGTVEARRLQKDIMAQPEKIERIISKMPDVQTTKRQNLMTEAQEFQQRQLNRTVEYINKQA